MVCLWNQRSANICHGVDVPAVYNRIAKQTQDKQIKLYIQEHSAACDESYRVYCGVRSCGTNKDLDIKDIRIITNHFPRYNYTRVKYRDNHMSEKDIIKINNNSDYDRLLLNVGTTLEHGRQQAFHAVNSAMVQTYWEIGRQIVEYEQHGNEKAEYGSGLLNQLSKDLTIRFGSGFSLSNINKMRKMYLTYPILQTVSAELTWSHYIELLKIDDPLERSFYEKECEEEHWGVRELKRQMKSMLFHRLALSTDKQEVLKLASEGQIIEKPEDILKEPYVFEFTGLPQLPVYEEGDLEEALVNNLSMFFLELGKGFTYVGRQQKMVIGGRSIWYSTTES